MQTEQQRRIQAGRQLDKNELYRRKIKIYGKKNWLTIPEDRKQQLSNKFGTINNIISKTTSHLTNNKNIAQIQGRVIRLLKSTEDKLNRCLLSASNTQQLHFCIDMGLRNLDNDIPRIKDILREY